jgi:hypothetical protein
LKLISEFNKTINANNTIFRSTAVIVLVVSLILLLPLLAMQFTDEVNWDLTDFLVAGTLLFGTGLTYQLAARKSGNILYRVALGIAIMAALLLVWINLAVGFFGSQENPANLMYIGVLAVGIIGANIARLRPHGMSIALFATALAHTLVVVIALIAGLGYPNSGPREIVIVNGFFIMVWVGSAWLFRNVSVKQDAV